jgi:hypothetical protein
MSDGTNRQNLILGRKQRFIQFPLSHFGGCSGEKDTFKCTLN